MVTVNVLELVVRDLPSPTALVVCLSYSHLLSVSQIALSQYPVVCELDILAQLSLIPTHQTYHSAPFDYRWYHPRQLLRK